MAKTIDLEDMIVRGLNKASTNSLERLKKIIKESTLITAEKNPNFNPNLFEQNPYKLMIKPGLEIGYDADVETARGCYIESVSVSPNASVILANRESLGIYYKGYKFRISYGEIPKK